MLPTGKMTGSEYYTDSVYQAHHKGSVTVMFGFMHDIIQAVGEADAATVGVPGYFKDVDGAYAAGTGWVNPERGLIFECKHQIKIEMPEVTGGRQVAILNEDQPNQYRKYPVYAYDEFVYTQPANPLLLRTDEQEPTTLIDDLA
jgi:hypothetical protein